MPQSEYKRQYCAHPVQEFAAGDRRKCKTAGNLKPAEIGAIERDMGKHPIGWQVRDLTAWKANLGAVVEDLLYVKCYYSSNTRCRARFHRASRKTKTIQALMRELQEKPAGGKYRCVFMGANYNGDDKCRKGSSEGHSVNKGLRRELVRAALFHCCC